MLFQFIFGYLSISFLLTNFLYLKLRMYYKKIKYKDPNTGKLLSLNEKFAPFVPHDAIYYPTFILSGTILFLYRSLASLLECFLFMVHLKILRKLYKNPETNPEHRKIYEKWIKFWGRLFLRINHISIEENQVEKGLIERVYTKYFGPDYDFYQKDYSLIISNHLGFHDVVSHMALFGSAFLSMDTLLKAPIGCSIAKGLGCIFVNKRDERDRRDKLSALEERQKLFLEKKNLIPLSVFPEGTTCNNRYIIKMKKGVFHQLLPLKPVIFKIDTSYSYHICNEVINLFFHVMRSMCHFSNKIYYINLPIIKPTQYMFEHFQLENKEKWEVYAYVAKRIYMEIGGLKESDLGNRDKLKYYKALVEGKYEEETNINDIKN